MSIFFDICLQTPPPGKWKVKLNKRLSLIFRAPINALLNLLTR